MKRPTNKLQAPSRKTTNHQARPTLHCSPPALCSKCALFMIVTLRFKAFELRFGRSPTPDEPLFFVPTQDQPVAVGPSEAIAQIDAAASELGIDAALVLQFLNLDAGLAGGESYPPADTPSRRAWMPPAGCERVRPIRPDCGSTPEEVISTAAPATEPDKPGVWKQFMNDQETHRRYQITGAELSMLSQVALMCEVLDQRDFIFILETVRQSAGN